MIFEEIVARDFISKHVRVRAKNNEYNTIQIKYSRITFNNNLDSIRILSLALIHVESTQPFTFPLGNFPFSFISAPTYTFKATKKRANFLKKILALVLV